MTTRTLDLTRFAQMVEILDTLAQRRSQQGSAAESLYYELLAGYYGQALHAREQGQALVAHSLVFPADLFHGMGLAPFCMEAGASTLMLLLQEYEELLNASELYGLKPFVCSVHRSLIGGLRPGVAPPFRCGDLEPGDLREYRHGGGGSGKPVRLPGLSCGPSLWREPAGAPPQSGTSEAINFG